jgi:hypothetical protein
MQFSRLTTPNTGSGGSSAKQNLTATAPPAVTDDVNAGYSVGSVWIDISADERWVCLDDTAGSAIWDKSTVGTASEVVNTPAGNITSTNVQSALNELDTLKGSQAQQTTNTNDIATNASNISANASNISTNTSNIASNTSALASKIASMVEDTSPQLGGTLDANSKAINEAQGANIASATTTDLGAMAGNYALVTGTTTITGLGTVSAGTRRKVTFTGILTLTHNATSLILPTEADITTAVNDTAEFISLGSGNWICTNYQRADGTGLVSAGGSVTAPDTDPDSYKRFNYTFSPIVVSSVAYNFRKDGGTVGDTNTTDPYFQLEASNTYAMNKALMMGKAGSTNTNSPLKTGDISHIEARFRFHTFTNPTNRMCIGFAMGGGNASNITSNSAYNEYPRAWIVMDGSTVYFVSGRKYATGGSTDITSSATWVGEVNDIRIVGDENGGSPTTKCYVNGTLVATHSSGQPWGDATYSEPMSFCVTGSSGNGYIRLFPEIALSLLEK